MVIRGEVVSVTQIAGDIHVIKLDNCVLVDGTAGEGYSRTDMYLTVLAKNDVFEIGKHYDMTVSLVAVEDVVPPEGA